ncbi:MAG: hypothetical protein KME64_34115 [Scytonematopsis contorta HA4267-MV1]|nr:hypothetical protein [Scytonematopsis contorta HA4267-MV1]
MTIPKKIHRGFSYNEAILMCRFCKQAYDIFAYDDGRVDDLEIRDIYSSIYRNQEWKCVHSFWSTAASARGFILKRTTGNQYVLVFRGSIITEQGTVDLTNIATCIDWEFVNYGSTLIQRIKVARGFLLAFESVSDEIIIFFKTLLGKLKPIDFQKLYQLNPLRQLACATAIARAGAILLGDDFEKNAKKLIEQAVEDGEVGNNDDIKAILNYEEEALLTAKASNPIEIYVTGHSLAGGLANLCALALRREFGVREDSGMGIKVYTFGGVKTGNKDFAEYYNQQIGLGFSYRVENVLDPVPSIPISPPFPVNVVFPEGLRIGNYFLGNYVAVGENYNVFGLGSQSFSVSFGGAFEFLGGIPFPHSYDSYFQLLKEQQEFWSRLLQPAVSILRPGLEEMLERVYMELQQEKVDQ